MASVLINEDGTHEVLTLSVKTEEATESTKPILDLSSVCGRAEASILGKLDLSPATTGDTSNGS